MNATRKNRSINGRSVREEKHCKDKTEENQIENGKRYGLRERKKYSLREEDFEYFDVGKPEIQCDCCQETFTNNAEFDSHIKSFACKNCSKKFCTKKILLDHVCNNKIYKKKQVKKKIKNKKEQFECGHCGIRLKTKTLLIVHISNECVGSKSFLCDICHKTFNNFDILKQHITAHMEERFNCDHCNQHYNNLDSLDQHFKDTGCLTITKVCQDCGKVFRNTTKLQIHILKHRGISHKCLTCYKVFTSDYALKEHVSSIDCSLTLHTCEICSKVLRSNVSYRRHQEMHRRKCSSCKKVFENETVLSEHLTNENCPGPTTIKYTCDNCGKKFLRLTLLQIHILNIHLGVNYQCDKCGVKLPSEADLQKHLCKSQGPYICSECGKVFSKAIYLRKHENMHKKVLHKCSFCYSAFAKEKTYLHHLEKMNCSKSARKVGLSLFKYKKCRICQFEFDNEEQLLNHFEQFHKEESPHQCFCCVAQLKNFEELKEHVHQHDIQKYTCRLCGKPYTSQEGYRKHRLKHQGTDLKCRHCETQFLNERRFRIHELVCKKNPSNGYNPALEKPKEKKRDDRPRQSRQLHWESRIIMKHLRGEPSSEGQATGSAGWSNDNAMTSFFDEDELANCKEEERGGWFDNYYKTEEDDIAFNVKKEVDNSQGYESDFDVTEFLHSGSIVRKKTIGQNNGASSSMESYEAVEMTEQQDNVEQETSNSSSSGDSSEEDDGIEEEQLPFEYNPKKCRVCQVTYTQEYELLHHFIKSHTGKHAHKCPKCTVELPLFAQLKEHMKTHGIGMGVYNCDNCSKRFKSEKKMRSHNIRCKGTEGEREMVDVEDCCKRCGKKFQTKCGYRRHKMTCKERKKKPKKLSSKPVEPQNKDKSDDETWGAPEASVESEEDTSEVVQGTGSAPEQSNVKEESKTQVGPAPEPCKTYSVDPPMDSFPCRLCDKKFQFERGIVMHFKQEHPGIKPLICHVCHVQLADKLKEHLKIHGIGEEFICELCGKRFNQKFLSKIHEMWHQGIEFKCSNCKQKFLNKEKMDKHISEGRCNNRQSLMRLPCDVCGKSYRSRFGLNKHLMTHTPKELRPIKHRMNCEFCGKWFENNNGLQRHRRIHTGERPFCCRFCPKAFAQEGNCKAHERIHTGEARPRKKSAAKPKVRFIEVNPEEPVFVYNYPLSL